MRKYNRVLPAVVALGLVGCFVVWQWYRGRQASAMTDRLVAQMRSEGREAEQYANALPPIPDPPLPAELERHQALVADRMKTFAERLREWHQWADTTLPHLSGARQQEVRDALAECTAHFGRAVELFKQRADHVRTIAGKS